MSKKLFQELDEKLAQVGLRKRKRVREQYDKMGQIKEVIKEYVRTAKEDGYELKGGRGFDDERAEWDSRIELTHTLKMMYATIKTEVHTRPEHHSLLLDPVDEEEYFNAKNPLDMDKFYELYWYCKRVARIVGIDTPHDINYLQEIEDTNGMPLAVRGVPESVVDRSDITGEEE